MTCETNQALLSENELVRLTRESVMAVNVHKWRLERLGSIARFETPDSILDGPKAVVHIVPLSLFGLQPEYIDLSHIEQELKREGGCRVAPPFFTSYSRAYSSDGFMTYASSAYLQVFRFGGIESVRQLWKDEGEYRLYVNIEAELLGCVKGYLTFLRDYGVRAPLVAMLSLTGAAGVTASYGSHGGCRIKEDLMLSPRVLITELSASLPEVMRPLLDTLCGVAGLPGSPLYNKSGKWIGPEF